MTSDINGVVVGIQGNAVSPANPDDGYVLVWSASDGYWKPQPQKKLRKEYFSSNGTWTAPDGITNVILIGSGGGGGGSGGINGVAYGGCGGGGCLQVTSYAEVVPNTTYNITIGVGGTGGAANSNGSDGSATTFGSLFTAIGAGRGISPANYTAGGMCIPDAVGSTSPSGAAGAVESIACGGLGGNGTNPISTGRYNPNGFIGGSIGSISTGFGGGGGGGGPAGVGANGGNGTNNIGGAGNNAANNTGAGGGGGGGGTNTGGAGGNGGSGYLYVLWVG